MPDDIPPMKSKTDRIVRLVDLQRQISYQRNQFTWARPSMSLVEGYGKKPKQLLGRNDGNKIVVFPDTRRQPGDFVIVRIAESLPTL